MNLTQFDPSQPVMTRAKMPATINRTDLKNPLYPIGATYFDQSGEECMSVFTKNGFFSVDEVEHPNDLINVGSRLKTTAYLVVYPDGRTTARPNRAAADAWAAGIPGAVVVEVNLDLPAVTT